MESIAGTYNYYLVIISISVAVLASYVTFDLIGITWNEKEKKNYHRWLLATSLVTGIGIWTMHFVGMFSYQLPLVVKYEPFQTVMSLLMAILGSYFGLLVIHWRHEAWYLLLGGTVMGAGIAGMHYMGMGAMHAQADMHYDYYLVMLSLLIAVSVSWWALRLFIKVHSGKIAATLKKRLIISCFFGLAISGMHYIGMAAASFTPNDRPLRQMQHVMIEGNTMLAAIVFSSVLLILTAIFLVKIKLGLAARLAQELGLMRITEQQLRSMIESAPDAFFIHDFQGQILDVNKSAYESLGYSREKLLSATVFDIEVGIEAEELKNSIWASLEDGSGLFIHGKHKRKDGTLFPVDINLTCIKDKDNSLIFALVRDMTEREKLKAHLAKLAMTDELTGVPNRRSFMESLDKEISRAQRKKTALSLLMIDLDFFKKINDEYGHGVGDLALKHFVREAKSTLRNEDIIGRVGGEEFAVLLIDSDLDVAFSSASRVRSVIENNVLEVESQLIKFTVSIGVASLSNGGMDSSTLMNNADIALYKAKENGRNRVEKFCE